jgi:hypothetical protein
VAGGGHAKQSESQKPAEFQNPRIPLATAVPARWHGKPDFIASSTPIDPLKQQVEIESKLELADDQTRRLIAAQSDEITAADFSLGLKAEPFEETLYRQVERCFPTYAMHRG